MPRQNRLQNPTLIRTPENIRFWQIRSGENPVANALIRQRRQIIRLQRFEETSSFRSRQYHRESASDGATSSKHLPLPTPEQIARKSDDAIYLLPPRIGTAQDGMGGGRA